MWRISKKETKMVSDAKTVTEEEGEVEERTRWSRMRPRSGRAPWVPLASTGIEQGPDAEGPSTIEKTSATG